MKLLKTTIERIIALSDNIASTDQTRYHLQNIEIKRVSLTNHTLSATDGHKMTVISVEDNYLNELDLALNQKFCINPEDLERLKVEYKIFKKGSLPFIECDIKKDQTKMPNFDQFIPIIKDDNKFVIGLNAEYLLEISKSFCTGRNKSIKFEFDFKDKTKPCIIRPCNESKDFAVLMPVRV